MNSLSKQFTTTTLVLIPVAIAVNIAIGQTIYNLGVPLYLDSIGTILVGVLAGPAAGALTGLLSNLIWGFTLNPVSAPYAAVGAIIGLAAGFIGEAGWAQSWWKTIIAGLIVGVISALVSAPITAYVYNGVTGNLANDALFAAYQTAFGDTLRSAFAQGATSDPLDKAVSFLIVWLIITALPERFRARFPQGVPPAKA